MAKRETFSSQLGFILMAAGCAIGLGNIWRFPYICARYGGGYFVLLYLLCLALIGLPIMLMEIAVGRAGQAILPLAFKNLRQPQSKVRWEIPGTIFFCGNMILLMFYTAVTGWLISYAWNHLNGTLAKVDSGMYADFFGSMLADPYEQIVFTLLVVILAVICCIGGIRKSVERVTKILMAGLFVLLLALMVHILLQPGAEAGVSFFLKPDWDNFQGSGFLPTLHAAMTQAFFTLSIGIGSIAICGSYLDRKCALLRHSVTIVLLDTLVAVAAGFIIFPACMMYGVQPDQGPSLIFIAMTETFKRMAGGRIWGCVFFLFMSMAALSTVIAVFENLVASGIDILGWKRWKSAIIFGIVLFLFSLPCIFGFNIWSGFQPFGAGSCVLDLEDFLVSDNLLPLGGMFIAIFCTSKYGWGMKNFYREVNTGSGVKIPRWLLWHAEFILPVLIFILWIFGIALKFKWITL